jgi:hypothetical protein
MHWPSWTAGSPKLAVPITLPDLCARHTETDGCAVGAEFPGTLASRRLPCTGRRNPYQPLW